MLMERTQFGKLKAYYFDEDTLSRAWYVYPYLPERLDLTSRSGWLRILPGSTDLYVLTEVPQEDFLCECRLDFIPSAEEDGAGICFFNSDDVVIKLLSFLEPGEAGVYDRLRFIKTGATIEAWARRSDNVWEFKGSTEMLPSAKIGFFLNRMSTRPVEFDQFVFVRSRYICVDNLPEGSRVFMIKDGSLIFDQVEHNRQVIIDLDEYQELILTAEIVVLNQEGMATSTSGLVELVGGDIFWHSYINLEVYYDGQPFSRITDNMLGSLDNGVIEIQLLAHNPDPYQGITSSLVTIEPEPDYWGFDWAFVAEDIDGVPGEWAKSIDLGSISANGYQPFWLRIVKRPTLKLAPKLHKFRLKVVGGAGGVS